MRRGLLYLSSALKWRYSFANPLHASNRYVVSRQQ